MRLAYGVEGSTWGPRVRARAVISRTGGTVVGAGAPRPPDVGLEYRRVRWTDPGALEGFDVVIGDPSCVRMRPRGVPGISIRIAGQQAGYGRHGIGLEPDLEWDAETYPLHPWAVEPLPTRADAVRWLRSGGGVAYPPSQPPAPDLPLLVILEQSWTPGLLESVVRSHVAPGWHVVPISGWGADRWIIGADLLVCSAGWAQVVQARAAGVPFLAVEQAGNDQWTRAHLTLAELPVAAANLEPAFADLEPGSRAHVEDHLPEFWRTVENVVERVLTP